VSRPRRGFVVHASGDDGENVTDGGAGAAVSEEAPKVRVFASRAAKTAPRPPPPAEQPHAAPGPGSDPASAVAAERRFGRFARDANGNFSRPEGTPVQPDGERAQRPRSGGDQPGGGRPFGVGDRFAGGRDGRPGGPFGGRGPGGGLRNGDRDSKGRKGRGDDTPQLFGKAATEARRNARASRKEERDAKSTKKERVEFIELPPRGLSVEELAGQLAVNSSEVIKTLFMKGIMTTVNQVCVLRPCALCSATLKRPCPCADAGQRAGHARWRSF
jgi:Translation initiation factor IF-2, N-terminal region